MGINLLPNQEVVTENKNTNFLAIMIVLSTCLIVLGIFGTRYLINSLKIKKLNSNIASADQNISDLQVYIDSYDTYKSNDITKALQSRKLISPILDAAEKKSPSYIKITKIEIIKDGALVINGEAKNDNNQGFTNMTKFINLLESEAGMSVSKINNPRATDQTIIFSVELKGTPKEIKK